MLRAYMQDDITVLYSNGEDIHNEPLATTDVEMKAYIVWKTHLLENIAGEKVISKGIIYVMPDRVITHADIIKINSTEYIVLTADAGKDFSSNHQEIHFQ